MEQSLNKRLKILYLVTVDSYFWSHRLELAREAMKRGFEVTVVTRVTDYGKQIENEGFKLIPINITRSGKNLFNELAILWKLIRIYKSERPDIVHHVAIKPVLYGSLAAWITKIPHVVNALTGMGYIFISNEWKAVLLRKFINRAFHILLNRPNSRLILQNRDDKNFMVQLKILDQEKIVLIPGSGVDTQVFLPIPEPVGVPVVMLVSRMLWHKGVGEFVEAARLLRNKGINACFVLVGGIDTENPAAIPLHILEEWNRTGIVEWWGLQNDMPRIFSKANIVCLPSYREGLPKVLIEAASCSRSIVATDVPGCREIVLHGKNGILVPVKNVTALSDALEKLIKDPVLRHRMGMIGRELVISKFSIERIVSQTIALYQSMCDS